MYTLENVEKSELRLALMKKIEAFIDELPEDNHLGYISDELTELMTDAAWSVLMAQHDIQNYYAEQDMIK